jgi:hypothetical protein
VTLAIRSIMSILGLCAVCEHLLAQDASPPPAVAPITVHQKAEPSSEPIAAQDADDFHFAFTGGYQLGFSSNIDDGGDFSVSRFDAGLALGRDFSPDFSASLRLSYRLDDYDFSSDALGLGAGDPWNDVDTVGAAAILNYAINERWRVFGGPIAQFSLESGADWSDSFTVGGVVAATYSFSKNLTVGGGVGVISQIEDDPRVFPILILNWNITKNLRLANQAGGANDASGIELAYTLSKWEFAIGGAYQFSRFRLDDHGPAPDGVGQNTNVSLWTRVSYTFCKNVSADLLAGLNAAGELRLEDEDGHRIASSDYDPAPFIGFNLKLQF